jgi:DNA-binding SARP family transcriptional activator
MLGLRLTTLGRYAITVGDRVLSPPATLRARALLVYLILNRRCDVARERLIEIFWPDGEPERARASLKTATWSIRRLLRDGGLDADAMLVADRATMRWSAPIDVDLEALFEAERSDDPARWRDAANLYLGEFLEGGYDPWTVNERERISAAYESLLRRLVEREGDRAAASALIERDPYHELAYSVLIEAALETGDRARAQALNARCRAALAQVGAVPSRRFELRFESLASRPPERTAAPRMRFAGREAELALLRERFGSAANGSGSITVIVGHSGMGKSALLARAGGLANDAGLRVLTCNAFDGDPRSFGPWQSLFEALIGEPFARFGAQTGFGTASRLADVLRRRLMNPTAILIDDAQALAGEAHDVLLELGAAAAVDGHAVVIATRQSAREHVPSIASAAITKTRIELRPLEMKALAVAFGLDAPSEPLLAELHRRSRGHPLFAGALLETLWQAQLIERVGGGWQLRGLGDALPESVHEALERRLRSRGENAAAAACALALEPSAEAPMLATALETDEAVIFDALDDLIAMGAVVQPDVGPPFRFAHDVLGEIAATLLHASRRAKLHARFADALANREERGNALRRARHFAASTRWPEALELYAAAATEAHEWGAWRDALDHARDGLALAHKLGNAVDETISARLEMLVANAHVLGGDDEGAQGAAAHAVHHARAAGDGALQARALRLAAAVSLNCHRVDDAIAFAQDAAELAERAGDQRLRSEALLVLTSGLAHAARRADGVTAAYAGLEAAQATGDPAVIASSADMLVRMHVMWWEFDEALAAAAIQLDAARRAGWLAEAAALATRGILWYYCGLLGAARDDLELVLRVASDERGERRWAERAAGLDRLKVRYFTRYMLGVVALQAGEYDAAVTLAEQLAGERLAKTSYMILNNVVHLWIDALLEQPTPGNVLRAAELLPSLREDPYEQGSLLDLSGSHALTTARVAAFSGAPDAQRRLEVAWEAVSRAAELRPLTSDVAFGRLAVAAEAAGLGELSSRARNAAAALAATRDAAVRRAVRPASVLTAI